MKSKIIEKIENFIKEKTKDPEHMLRTGYWLREIYPEADDIIYIAAISHDVERSLREDGLEIPPNPGWNNELYLLWHGGRSAEIMGNFLEKEGFKEEEIDKLKNLIRYHEIGGDFEKDLIKDADSLSFLEIKPKEFIKRIPETNSKEEVREKFDFMFNRISSEKAREIARPFYEEAIEKLENK